MLSLEGKQLGNYDVTRRIRVGGMGAVYEGRQRTAFDRRVAIKVILGDYAADRDMRRRFMREARTVARLHHPHILPLIEFGDEQGILYLVMPFIEGGTLTSYLRRDFPGLGEVAAIYEQLLDAVEYAHDEGLIHRDIKSSNVLLEMRRSGPPYVYLADFGLVRTRRQAEMEDTGKIGKPIPLDQVPGTPHYMAPEQTRGIITPLTDIYALGVLLYQMLTGKLPYNDDNDVRVIQMHLNAPIPSPCDQDASIPRELGEVVRTAMAKRPEDRYQNIAELRAAFLAAIKGPAEPVEDEEPELLEQAIHGRMEEGTRQINLRMDQSDPYAGLKRPVPSAPLPEQPMPAIVPRRGRGQIAPLAVREVRNRTTETVRPHRQRARLTEETVPLRRKRRSVPRVTPMVAMSVAPIVLLLVLLVARVLGVALLPAGFPLLGASPIATVYITVQSRTLQDSYILTASPQVQAPDLATRTIPSRLLQSVASKATVVQTTGTRSINSAQAQGTVEFLNPTHQSINLPAQFTLTDASGVQVQLMQSVVVPPHHDGHDGTAEVPAVATKAGATGNIPSHALDGSCCNNGLQVQNPDPFSGGSDGQTVHVVAQADLDNAQKAFAPALQQQIQQQMQKQLFANEVIAGSPSYKITTTASSPVGSQNDRVQITVTVSASAVVYNHAIANQIAAQLLSKEATQTLGSGYRVQEAPTIIAPPRVQPGNTGIVYLSISVRGLWVYALDQAHVSQWIQSIKGATAAAASAFLKQQAGVKDAQIQLPFGTDHLPTATDQIRIILVGSK